MWRRVPAWSWILIAVIAVVAVTTVVIATWPRATSRTSTGLPPRVTLKPIDGGLKYFSSLHPASAWMDTTMLLGGWEEQPHNATEVGYDAAMGNNIYWNLAGHPGSDRVDYNVINAGGMHACAPDMVAATGRESVCSFAEDELDMKEGPRSTGYGDASAGYSNPVVPDTVSYSNYGKGVLFSGNKCYACWETGDQAAKWLTYTDILSADSYWMTDPDLDAFSQGGCSLLPRDPTACTSGRGLTTAQRALPANYAYNVTHLEQLQAMNGPSKPVIVAVETGCGSNGACTTPSAMTAAAWHAIIAGARGIVWFQHNFGGPCFSYASFYVGSDPSDGEYSCRQTPGVTMHDVVLAVSAVNHQVADLNDVLLSPLADGYVSTGGADVSSMAKYSNGTFYVFAGSGEPGMPPSANQRVTFRLAARYTGPVTVVGEGRTLQAVNGVFTDTFADANAVHIYRIG